MASKEVGKFSVGDRVICQNTEGSYHDLILGREYVVVDVDWPFVRVGGSGAWFRHVRFDPAPQQDGQYVGLKTELRDPVVETAGVSVTRVHTTNPISPSHYNRHVIEPIAFIEANRLPYDVGNVIKYVCRYDAKNGEEDLLKARQYVDFLIERVRREKRIAAGESPAEVWKGGMS